MNLKKNQSGIVLITVMGITLVIMLMIPVLVKMVSHEAKWSVKQQQTTTAFHLAEAAVDRGVWKLKSSTNTFADAAAGITLTGYNFDKTYSDIPGGTYRVIFSSGPGTDEVTIVAEGRDDKTNNTRAIQQVVENRSIPSAIMSAGNINMEGNFQVHWGPVMSQSNITLSGARIPKEYYPRKYSKQVVSSANPSWPRDTNGLVPPNTDNVEWWSDYPVTDLPLIDFTTLRSSASTTTTSEGTDPGGTTTLNYYRDYGSIGKGSGYKDHGIPDTFHGTEHHADHDAEFIWYWDGDVDFTGAPSRRHDLRGTIIVMGDMTVSEEDGGSFVVDIPDDAHLEYAKIDTGASDEYPGDTGLGTHAATFELGVDNWSTGPAQASWTDVGFSGFMYIAGDLNLNDVADMQGAVWVGGDVYNSNTGEYTILFYDDAIELPTLNVVIVLKSWQEISPSAVAWP